MKYDGCFGVFLVLALHLATADILRKNVHESMTQDELRDIFHVDSIHHVPEYQLVNVRSRSKRSADEETHTVHVSAFDSHHKLNLRPNKHISRDVPVYYADHDPKQKKVVLNKVPSTQDEDIGVPHQDEENLAAVLVKKDPETGSLLVDGIVGSDLVIKPMPTSVLDVLNGDERRQSVASRRNENWRREDERNLNGIAGASNDEAFLDDDQEHLQKGDLIFSDGFPFVADDNDNSGRRHQVSQPYGDGVLPSNKTLPDGLELLRRRKRAVSHNEPVHVMFKKPKTHTSSYDVMNPDHIPSRSANSRVKRSSRDAPSVIYPEILVLVDYDGYLLHGQDNTKIKSYYVSFWNGADLRYKLLREPKVKISIAGIIISRSRDAMPYLERNRVGRDAIDSASALTDMGKYLFQERRLPTYDIAVAITKLDMCRRAYEGGNCNRGTAGFAYVGGACVVNKRLQKVNSVAIVEDTGGFSGIIVAAHEVGHLLGAVHDGSPPPSYLGGPGARRCRWEDGYIMSDLRHTEKGFRWSHCSTEQFHHFLNGDTATCLYNLPHEDESLPRILPGKLLSLDQQCRKDRGTSACFKDDRVCAQLFCFDSQSGYCVSYRPAAEGSDCGGGKICLNGRCVHDNENSISDHDLHGSDDSFFSKSSTKEISSTTTTQRKQTTTTTTSKPTTTKKTTTTTKKPTTTTTTKKPSTTTKKPTTTTTTKKPTTTSTKARPALWSTGRTSRRTTTSVSTTSRSSSFSTSTTPKANKKLTRNRIKAHDGDCVDRISNITGSLTCREFLESYGARYCGHKYIRKNCCKARNEICKDFL